MDEKNLLDEKTLETVSGGEDGEEETNECPYSGNARMAMKHAVNRRCPHKG